MRVRQTDRPSGVSFSLPELLLTQSWAEFHDVRMVVELDYAFDGQKYDEVISLYRKGGKCRRCLLWRTAEFVVVQPIIGRMSRFISLSDALDSFRLSGPKAPISDVVLGSESFPSAEGQKGKHPRPQTQAGDPECDASSPSERSSLLSSVHATHPAKTRASPQNGWSDPGRMPATLYEGPPREAAP